MAGRHPDLSRELPQLRLSLLAFALLTAASAGSFLGQVKGAPGALGACGDRWRPERNRADLLAAPRLTPGDLEENRFSSHHGLSGAPRRVPAALLAACTAHRAPPPSTDIDEALVRNDMRTLASDDFEGRRPGTAGEEKTVAFLTDQFKKLGLKPGNGESYVQQVPLVEITRGEGRRAVDCGARPACESLALRQGHGHLDPARGARPSRSRRASWCSPATASWHPEFDWNDYAGDRRARQDGARAHAAIPATAGKEPDAVQGQRPELLRALGVQGRRGRPSRRGRPCC